MEIQTSSDGVGVEINKDILDTMTITITQSVNEPGFFYAIYACEADQISDFDTEELDGGHCTSENIHDALGMATSQAQDLIRKARYNIK